MNLSKKEKLLAAKKKLREFQMNKMTGKEISSNQKHIEDAIPSQCQPAETTTTDSEVVNNVPVIEPASENITLNDNEIRDTYEQSVKHSEEIEQISPKQDIQMKELSQAQRDILIMAYDVADALADDSEQKKFAGEFDFANRTQYLNDCLLDQKNVDCKLLKDLNSSQSRIKELEAKLEAKEIEFETRLAREINPLKEQLQIHMQTTGILIAEKAELTAALAQVEQSSRQSIGEIEELTGKYKNAQHCVIDLEKETFILKSQNEELRKNFYQLQSQQGSLDKGFFELKKEKEDLDLEVSELKQKLNLKKTELITVQEELNEKTALLSLSELRIQQMKGTAPSEEERHATASSEQEFAQTKESLNLDCTEKEEANKQYQNYAKQMKLLEEIKAQKTTIEDLQGREQSYVQRLSELEQQLQQEKGKVEYLLPLQDSKEKIDNLLKNIDELTLEQERLHITLSEKNSQIDMLTKDVNDLREANNQDLHEANNQEAEVTKLATALESEKLGASRAVHQNRQLKEQLTDMENAFVSLSNAKLDLTEQLQAERSIGRKLNAQLNNVETELEKFKEKLKEKEAVLGEFEKERLQTAQIADQMQHYQAQSHYVDTFQREFQNALVTIERLEKERHELLDKLKGKRRESISENESIVVNSNDVDSPLSALETQIEKEETYSEALEESVSMMSEPVKQLEQRFKQTMERVAELTEEKQKLEHLVLQLQSETETIGEYITLYQKQRAILQNRAKEREQVFRELLEQRNQQQEQLHKLKVFVSDFLRKEYIHTNGTEYLVQTETDYKDSKEPVVLKRKKEATESPTENKSVSDLIDVLTEIKDCKDTCLLEPNFHPCPWCSGKLLTV